MRQFFFLFSSLILVSALPARAAGPLPVGSWGGNHVAMSVDEKGAHLEFDCAHADISEPLTVDANGRVHATGVYVQEHGGPIRPGEPSDIHAATFDGQLQAVNSLVLELDIATESDQKPMHYTLRFGDEGRVFKCL